MRKDRHIAGALKFKEAFVEPCRRNMMGCFHQHIAGIGEGEKVPALQALDEVGCDMHIGPGDQIEVDATLVEFLLQGRDPLANIGTAIGPNAGKDVRCAGHNPDAVCDGRPSHIEGDIEIGRAIIDSRQQMRVQINHRCHSRLRSGDEGVGGAGVCGRFGARRMGARPKHSKLEPYPCGVDGAPSAITLQGQSFPSFFPQRAQAERLQSNGSFVAFAAAPLRMGHSK